jgi:hypothetical protein
MQDREVLDLLNLWEVFVATVAVALLSLEGGFRLGAYRHRRSRFAASSAFSAVNRRQRSGKDLADRNAAFEVEPFSAWNFQAPGVESE